jgi:hypothetical protein
MQTSAFECIRVYRLLLLVCGIKFCVTNLYVNSVLLLTSMGFFYCQHCYVLQDLQETQRTGNVTEPAPSV